MPVLRGLFGVALTSLAACASNDEVAPPPDPVGCTDPLAFVLPDGNCFRPGIPVDGCAAGFEHDGEYGCEPILPAEVCAAGLMAVPGETTCRPVMPCAVGRWGDIAVDATTEYVDGAYTGGASDGSESQPWTSIGDAVAAAAPSGLIAISLDSSPIRREFARGCYCSRLTRTSAGWRR